MRRCSIGFCGALLGSTALAGAAFAQTYIPPAAPPIRETIDGNGVDLTRGTLVSRAHSLSIGGPGNHGIGWSRTITATGAFRDSTAGVVSGSTTVTVSIGGHSESFTVSGGNYVSVEKTGATLTKAGTMFTFTTADAVVFTFAPKPAAIFQYSGSYALTQVAYPTGDKQTYAYEVAEEICSGKPGQLCATTTTAARLKSVTANNGYALYFDFVQAEAAWRGKRDAAVFDRFLRADLCRQLFCRL